MSLKSNKELSEFVEFVEHALKNSETLEIVRSSISERIESLRAESSQSYEDLIFDQAVEMYEKGHRVTSARLWGTGAYLNMEVGGVWHVRKDFATGYSAVRLTPEDFEATDWLVVI